MAAPDPHIIGDLEALERLYGTPAAPSIAKQVDYLHPCYRAFVEAAPFVALATSGPDGLDVSPRGDPAGCVEIVDDKTLLLPDRRGNNRIDSLRNILADPRVALLFLIPGVNETLRVNGVAEISIDPVLLERLATDGKSPRTVLRIHVEQVFIQCSRALLRSRLWDPASCIDRAALPSTGTILDALSSGEIDAGTYDAGLAERLKTTIY